MPAREPLYQPGCRSELAKNREIPARTHSLQQLSLRVTQYALCRDFLKRMLTVTNTAVNLIKNTKAKRDYPTKPEFASDNERPRASLLALISTSEMVRNPVTQS